MNEKISPRDLIIRDPAIYPATFEGILAQAETLVKSGFVPTGVKTAAQAVAVIMTGRELGIGPMHALRGIYIAKNGQPTLTAQLIGALIRRAGHEYHVVERTEVRCTIEFCRKGGRPYRHTVTMEEAKKGKWDQVYDSDKGVWKQKPAWVAHPKALLFARCLTEGARIEMPDAIANLAYVPDEFDIDVEEFADAEVIEEATVEEEAVVDQPSEAAEAIREALQIHAQRFAKSKVVSEAQLGLLCGKVNEALQAKGDKPRHLVFKWLWDIETGSGRELEYGAVGAMLKRWVEAQDKETGDYPLAKCAYTELPLILRAAEIEAGQLELIAQQDIEDLYGPEPSS